MSSNDPKRPPRPTQLPADKPDVDRPEHPIVEPDEPETKPDPNPKPGDRPRPEQPIAPPAVPSPPHPEPRREVGSVRHPGSIPGDTIGR